MILAAVFAVVLATSVAHATSVVYKLSGVNSGPGGDGLNVAFVFTSSGFVSGSSITQVLASQLSSCANCVNSTTIPAVEFRPNDIIGDAIGFIDVNQVENFYRFPFGALTTPGTYSAFPAFNPGTLTVTVVPEPGTMLLVGSGIVGLIGSMKRKLYNPRFAPNHTVLT